MRLSGFKEILFWNPRFKTRVFVTWLFNASGLQIIRIHKRLSLTQSEIPLTILLRKAGFDICWHSWRGVISNPACLTASTFSGRAKSLDDVARHWYGRQRAALCTNVAITIIIDKKNCRSNYRISLFLSHRLDVKKLQINFLATCAVSLFLSTSFIHK